MKIICIGRNYAAHARELNNAVEENPVIFLKPETALIPGKQAFFYPSFSQDVHFETELVVRINKLGKNIEERFAHRYYNEVTLGIDFTARDLQQELKTKGLPWETAKAFDGSAPVGKFLELQSLNKTIQELNFRMELNGVQKQNGSTADMLFGVNKLIAHASKFFTLKIGDLLFTGTPAGVGPVKMGDNLEAWLENQKVLSVKVR